MQTKQSSLKDALLRALENLTWNFGEGTDAEGPHHSACRGMNEFFFFLADYRVEQLMWWNFVHKSLEGRVIGYLRR